MQKTIARAIRADKVLRSQDDCARPYKRDHAAASQTLDMIFRRERDGLVRYLKRRVGPDLACDIAQEVFVRAATSPRLHEVLNPRAFLFCIARNLLVDLARRQRCRVSTMPLNEADDARCAAEQEYELEADDLKSCLERALTALPERTRTIFVMSRFDEMAYRDIHHELDISMAAVEYHMMKALSHIRVTLADAA